MVSQNLSYILGALRDGSLPKCGIKKEVTLATDPDLDWLSLVAQKAAKEFSMPISKFKIYEIWDRKSKKPCYRLKIYSKRIYGLLSEHCEPGDQISWKTPNAVKNASLEVQTEYIAAFYDAEGGCRNVSRFQGGFTRSMHCWSSFACTHSELNEPLLFIQKILKLVGITSQLYRNNELVMTGKENLRRFYENFPLQHEKKKKQLRELLQFYGTPPVKA